MRLGSTLDASVYFEKTSYAYAGACASFPSNVDKFTKENYVTNVHRRKSNLIDNFFFSLFYFLGAR